jgi:hypothetical protein
MLVITPHPSNAVERIVTFEFTTEVLINYWGYPGLVWVLLGVIGIKYDPSSGSSTENLPSARQTHPVTIICTRARVGSDSDPPSTYFRELHVTGSDAPYGCRRGLRRRMF